MTEKEKIFLNVGVESNHEHSCKGYVLYCMENERSIASFWHEHDAEKAEIAINSYDQHIGLIAKQEEQIKMLREAVSSASIALSECANELNCFIDMKNSDLESSVTSCTENQPDYFDAQTVHESMVVVNNLQKALSATEQK